VIRQALIAGLALALALACPSPTTAAPSRTERVDLSSIVLPPEAARHNDVGMQAYEAGDFAAAYRAFKLSYASMDPHDDLHARDMILGSLRGSLVKLYEKTGELEHLCLARAELLSHLETLLLTFGEDTELQDVPGIKSRLRQLNQKISRHTPRMGEATCDGPPVQLERPTPPPRTPAAAPPAPKTPDRSRPALIVGATGLSVGGVLLGAMTYALFMRRASVDGIKALGASAMMQPGVLPTREQRALADTLVYVGRYHRTTAIATGISGGALVLSGVIALIVRRALRGRVTRVALQPAPTLTGGTLFATAHF
jgi:hypothetical protein